MEEERFKAEIFHVTQQVCNNTAAELRDSESRNVIVDELFCVGVTEMVWEQIRVLAKDVEDFAEHAGRKTIQPQDVVLCCRRNEGLHEMMNDYQKEIIKSRKKRKENSP
ncbi:CENP-S protein [Schizosaccharomyces cryophilus OY26]|uniref:CENP-S protein n=1 Tax=Schizosaccharomyces cryophilus (strain OY26 / ATCC MYA-4695 / CBS 11777 / NBRC 106824 / NRRL Y48691) TaxID=653667 RepID=S9X9Y4_SCHCR|nr:CENP-S protein [Schizosaccharomyces cryophilus OY26]EPY53942.1 CENP-S protein [Schizosaccharomyces cryophilus OY26]